MADQRNGDAATHRTDRGRPAAREPAGTWSMPFPPAGDAMDALRACVMADEVAVCICDADDAIRYMNGAFRDAFSPHYDGCAATFASVLGAAIRIGLGIRLTSSSADDFCGRMDVRRRTQLGSVSFTTDTCDGRWWWVTDTKLASGWMVVVAQDISSLKHQEFALRDAHANALEEAQTDDLTGAPNRRHGLRRAEAAVAAARSDGHALTVALMDLDHFKAINDRHGHDGGDRAVRHFARFMMSAVGGDDQFSRLGGDEFLLVSPGAGPGALESSLSAMLAAMPNLRLPGVRDGLRLSISVGIAALMPDERWPDLLRRADRALYAAKAGGRDRIALAA